MDNVIDEQQWEFLPERVISLETLSIASTASAPSSQASIKNFSGVVCLEEDKGEVEGFLFFCFFYYILEMFQIHQISLCYYWIHKNKRLNASVTARRTGNMMKHDHLHAVSYFKNLCNDIKTIKNRKGIRAATGGFIPFVLNRRK